MHIYYIYTSNLRGASNGLPYLWIYMEHPDKNILRYIIFVVYVYVCILYTMHVQFRMGPSAEISPAAWYHPFLGR